MGVFLLLLLIAIVVSFFAFREDRDISKPISNNSVEFAKSRLLKDKDKYKNNLYNLKTEDLKPKEVSSVATSKIYVFVSSQKFHRENCRFANKKLDPISIESAKAQNLSPCKICNPHKD